MIDETKTQQLRNRPCTPSLLKSAIALHEEWEEAVLRGEMKYEVQALDAFRRLFESFGNGEYAEKEVHPVALSACVGLRTMCLSEDGAKCLDSIIGGRSHEQ